MRAETETNPLVAFFFFVLLVVAVLIGSTATTHQGGSGALSASATGQLVVSDRS
ncbi:hypothetical protein BH10PSE9_BH10PSE9_14160 [soil metagenome]